MVIYQEIKNIAIIFASENFKSCLFDIARINWRHVLFITTCAPQIVFLSIGIPLL